MIGYGFTGEGRVCHTDDPAKPDCYRRIMVYNEPFGKLKDCDPLPPGIDAIWFTIEEAMTVARKHCPYVTVNGKTALDILAAELNEKPDEPPSGLKEQQ
jgi:hypothetical protein